MKKYTVTFYAPEIKPCTPEQMKMLLRNPGNWPLIKDIQVEEVYE